MSWPVRHVKLVERRPHRLQAASVHTFEQVPTEREIEVLLLVSDGLANREIGERLFLSEETVKTHVRSILAKLQARSRAHAVAVAFRRGLIV